MNVAILSHILDIHLATANLMDGDDIFRCSRDFVRKANGILIKFRFCDHFILTKLLIPVSVYLFMAVLYGHLTLV